MRDVRVTSQSTLLTSLTHSPLLPFARSLPSWRRDGARRAAAVPPPGSAFLCPFLPVADLRWRAGRGRCRWRRRRCTWCWWRRTHSTSSSSIRSSRSPNPLPPPLPGWCAWLQSCLAAWAELGCPLRPTPSSRSPAYPGLPNHFHHTGRRAQAASDARFCTAAVHLTPCCATLSRTT